VRTLLKNVLDAIAIGLAIPCACLYWMGSFVVSSERAFPGWSQAMSLLPGLTGIYLRRAFYRLTLTHCGKGSVVSFGTVFSHPSVQIGRSAYIGVFCCIGDVNLEDDVLIGSHVTIMNGNRQHGIDRMDIPVREQPGQWPKVTVGRDSWIGDRSVVMADVGQHCVVGAGAVVTRPVPDYAIVVGVPARIIGWRNGRRSEVNAIGDEAAIETMEHAAS